MHRRVANMNMRGASQKAGRKFDGGEPTGIGLHRGLSFLVSAALLRNNWLPGLQVFATTTTTALSKTSRKVLQKVVWSTANT